MSIIVYLKLKYTKIIDIKKLFFLEYLSIFFYLLLFRLEKELIVFT